MMNSRKFDTLHVNLFGIPGTGKSGVAAGLYKRLNEAGYVVELVREYAKELAWRGDLVRRDVTGELVEAEQFVISAEQYRRQAEVDGRVQVAVTDSPVPLGVIFAPADYASHLQTILRQLTAGWNNLDVLLERDLHQSYESLGRIQSREESLALAPELLALLMKDRPGFIRMPVDQAEERLFRMVAAQVELRPRTAALRP